MQQVNDRLFETDKLMSMQGTLFGGSRSSIVRSSSGDFQIKPHHNMNFNSFDKINEATEEMKSQGQVISRSNSSLGNSTAIINSRKRIDKEQVLPTSTSASALRDNRREIQADQILDNPILNQTEKADAIKIITTGQNISRSIEPHFESNKSPRCQDFNSGNNSPLRVITQKQNLSKMFEKMQIEPKLAINSNFLHKDIIQENSLEMSGGSDQPPKKQIFASRSAGIIGKPIYSKSNITTNNNSNKSGAILIDYKKIENSDTYTTEQRQAYQEIHNEIGVKKFQIFKQDTDKSTDRSKSERHKKRVQTPLLPQQQKQSRSNSTSNLTNNGKSEPMCSDMETQRQTINNSYDPYKNAYQGEEILVRAKLNNQSATANGTPRSKGDPNRSHSPQYNFMIQNNRNVASHQQFHGSYHDRKTSPSFIGHSSQRQKNSRQRQSSNSSQVICKNQMLPTQLMIDQIKQKNRSSNSIRSSSNCSQFVIKNNQFKHMSSVQHIEDIQEINATRSQNSQNFVCKNELEENDDYLQSQLAYMQEYQQSSKNWTQSAANNTLPEHIHSKNPHRLPSKDLSEGTLNSQNFQNLSILKHMQQNLIQTQGDNNIQNQKQLVDPKNLRNFFIQSSLTFNGNMNSNSKKTNSILGSMSQYEHQDPEQRHDCDGTTQDYKHFIEDFNQHQGQNEVNDQSYFSKAGSTKQHISSFQGIQNPYDMFISKVDNSEEVMHHNSQVTQTPEIVNVSKYEQLQQEIIDAETQKLQIEQELLGSVEQRRQLREELDQLTENFQQLQQHNEQLQNENFDLQQQFQNQINFFQQALQEKDQALNELQNHNNFLQERELKIHDDVQKLKSKYKQKLEQKEEEIRNLRGDLLHKGSFGVEQTPPSSLKKSDAGHIRRQSVSMDLNLSPVTHEIEKLRTYIGGVVEQLGKNDNRPPETDILAELRNLISNSDAQRENQRLRQELENLKQEIGLQQNFTNQQQDQLKKISDLQSKWKNAEDLVMQERLDRYKKDLECKQQIYESQLQQKELKVCLSKMLEMMNLKYMIDYRQFEVSDQYLKKLLKKVQNFIKDAQKDPKYKEILKQLQYEQKTNRHLLNQIQEIRGNIRVVCRVRPPMSFEKNKRVEFTFLAHNKLQTVNQQKQTKTYVFDRVFKPKSKQSDIFEEVQGLVNSAMDGYNVCVMAYGQTASGKTYTMIGDDKNPGLYFNAVDEIYRVMKQKQPNTQYDISVSVVEIYNEQIRDLLSKESHNVKLQENYDGDVLGDQTKRKVTSKNHILKALRDACYCRSIGVTNQNEYSSRSHFVLTVYVTGYDKQTKHLFKGKLSMVDLAGSERILRTQAEGIRIKEAQSINQSLSTLSKVFINLQNNNSHIPYRDSKLTHYLKDSIGGNAKTMLILQVSPCQKDHQESLSTLSFGHRTQQIEFGTIKPISSNFSTLNNRKRSLSSKSLKKMSKNRSLLGHGPVKKRDRSFSSQRNSKSLHFESRNSSMPTLSRSMMNLPAKGSKQKFKIPKSKKSLSRSLMKFDQSTSQIMKPPTICNQKFIVEQRSYSEDKSTENYDESSPAGASQRKQVIMNFQTNPHVSANESRSSTRDYLKNGQLSSSTTMLNGITNATSDLNYQGTTFAQTKLPKNKVIYSNDCYSSFQKNEKDQTTFGLVDTTHTMFEQSNLKGRIDEINYAINLMDRKIESIRK